MGEPHHRHLHRRHQHPPIKIEITIIIIINRVLSDNELSILEESLNNVDIDVLNIDTSLKNVKVAVLNVTDSFNPKVTVGNIQLCIASTCKS